MKELVSWLSACFVLLHLFSRLEFRVVFNGLLGGIRAPDKRGIEENSKIIFLFLSENICCDPSLEPSRTEGSNDRSQKII